MAKKEVISSVTQLMSAYRKHYNSSKAEKEDISHFLLLFYAVECGVKAQYLKDYNGKTTDDFTTLPTKKKYGHGHHILDWLKELNIPATVGHFKDDENRPLFDLHERLRYGVFSERLEKDQIAFLKKIAAGLHQSLNS